MTYIQGGSVDDADITSFVTTVNTRLTELGQANISTGSEHFPVFSTTWSSLQTAISKLGSHKGSTIATLPGVLKGGLHSYSSALSNNIANINNLNAIAQDSSVTNFTETTLAWYNYLTFTQSIVFPNATAANNYFNSGGQIALSFLHPANTNPIDTLFNKLASDCGTLILSGHTTGTVTIAATGYTGFAKLGGGGNAPSSLSTNTGYRGLSANSAAPTTLFKQIGGSVTGTSGTVYNTNFIQVQAYTANAGNTITFVTTWDEVPNGLVTGAGSVNGRTRSTTYVTLRPPSLSYITNSWGTPTFNGTVTGQ